MAVWETFLDTTAPYLRPNSALNFIVEATATVTIPPGDWTIGLGSDEGGLLRLEEVNFSGESNTDGDTPGDNELRHEGRRRRSWTTGHFSVGPGGLTTQLTALMFERNGIDSFEVAIRSGHHNHLVVADDWVLLENGALGWNVLQEATASRTDLENAMRDVSASVWTRGDFQIDDPTRLDSLTLQISLQRWIWCVF